MKWFWTIHTDIHCFMHTMYRDRIFIFNLKERLPFNTFTWLNKKSFLKGINFFSLTFSIENFIVYYYTAARQKITCKHHTAKIFKLKFYCFQFYFVSDLHIGANKQFKWWIGFWSVVMISAEIFSYVPTGRLSLNNLRAAELEMSLSYKLPRSPMSGVNLSLFQSLF